MKAHRSDVVFGAALIGVGALLLLGNLGLIGHLATLIWSFLFALGGILFLVTFFTGRGDWWALIPASALFGLSLVTGLNALLPWASGWLSGAAFLGMLGLGFWAVYLASRHNWWAVIPGGTLLTLAAVVAAPEVLGSRDIPGVLFLGLAATFGLVYILPTPYGRNTWAAIPAVVLLILGAVVSADTLTSWGFVWPGALILLGLYQLYRGVRRAP